MDRRRHDASSLGIPVEIDCSCRACRQALRHGRRTRDGWRRPILGDGHLVAERGRRRRGAESSSVNVEQEGAVATTPPEVSAHGVESTSVAGSTVVCTSLSQTIEED